MVANVEFVAVFVSDKCAVRAVLSTDGRCFFRVTVACTWGSGSDVITRWRTVIDVSAAIIAGVFRVGFLFGIWDQSVPAFNFFWPVTL
ncbi:hypothetical protein P5E35_14315, partial [Clostridium perfringens]|nr:hypothetical protein [Clostridium perfringens]